MHVVNSLLGTLRSSWKSCLIFEHNILCSVTAVVSDPQIIRIQSQIQIQRCNSKSHYRVIEGDDLTKIPDESRDGMETTQTGSLTKRHTGPLHASIPSTQSVTLAPHLSSRMISNELSSIVYYMLSRLLYPLSRESPCGGDWRNVRSACRTQTGTLMSL